MNRRDLRTFVVMIVLFSLVFGPILLFAWKDWREILLLGVERQPEVVDYVWNNAGSGDAPTPFSASISGSSSRSTAAYILITGPTTSPLLSSGDSSTQLPVLSATSEDRSHPTQTPSRIPTRTPTHLSTRTPTRIPSGTPTKMPTKTLQPSETYPPEYVSTNTPRPTATNTRRPTRTPTPDPPTPIPPTPIPPTPKPPTETEPPPYP